MTLPLKKFLLKIVFFVRRPWISEHLQELRKKKFNDELDNIPDVSGNPGNPLYVSSSVVQAIT